MALLKDRDRELVKRFCGLWHHPLEEARFERAGTRVRQRLGTRFGTIFLKVHRVRDRASGGTFVPLWRDVLLDGQRVFQPDVTALAEQFTERMSYRNTREELAKVVPGVPSPRPINRRGIEDGNLVNDKIRERELEAGTIMPDGTEFHAQKGGHHQVNITLAVRPGKKPLLRCLTVGAGWGSHRKTLDRTAFRDEKGAPIPPSQHGQRPRERSARGDDPAQRTLECGPHPLPRATGFALWQDGMERPRRLSVIQTVSGLLAHLRNSLAYPFPRGERDAVEHRIQQTTKRFRRLGTLLHQEGYRRAARLLHRVSSYVTPFATWPSTGSRSPGTATSSRG